MRDKNTIAHELDREWMRVKNELDYGDLGVDMDAIAESILEDAEVSIRYGREIELEAGSVPELEIKLDTNDLETLIGEAVLALQAEAEAEDADPYAVMHGAGFTRDHAIALAKMVEVVSTMHNTLGDLTGNGLTCMGYGNGQITPELLDDIRRILSNLGERLPAPAPVTDTASEAVDEEVRPLA